MDSIKNIGLADLEKQTQASWSDGKVAFFFDLNGNAETFFKYTATICELHVTQTAMSLGHKTLDDVKEDIRLKFKSAMHNGYTLCLSTGNALGRFKEYIDPTYFPEECFEPSKITDEAVYKKVLREGEDVDVMGNQGGFFMKEGFKVAILTTMNPDEVDQDELAERVDTSKLEFVKIE